MRQRLIRAIARRREPAAGQAGYSLPEVLIAALILAVGIGALMMLFANAGQGSQTSSRQDVAAAVASQELENMRSYPYSSLALSDSPQSLPDGRLVNGQFQPTSGPAEDLVTSAAGGLAAVPPLQVMNGVSYQVYRVVSWTNQSCPLSAEALSRMSNAIATLYTAINTVEGTLNTLNGTTGTQGLIARAQSNISSLVNGLLGSLLTAYQSLQNHITQLSSLLSPTLSTGLQNELSAIQGDLNYLRSQNLIDSTGHLTITSLDLCHLPRLALPNITQFTTLATALTDPQVGVENSLSTSSTSAQAELSLAVGFNSLTGLGVITGTDGNLSGDNTNIQTSMSSNGALSGAAISAVHTGLTDLKSVLNCVNNLGGCLTGTHVTKRISVAVVLTSPHAGVGPQQAVWMSSLVTDPSDGLL